MKNYFIRLIFGLLTLGIASGLAYIFQIDWLSAERPERKFFMMLIVVAGGWGGWYLIKGKKKDL